MDTLNHPHTRLHILLSILAFVLVVGSITLYQIRSVQAPEQVQVREEEQKLRPGDLTTEQRDKAIADMKAVAAKSPPLTDAQRAKAIADMKKAASNINK